MNRVINVEKPFVHLIILAFLVIITAFPYNGNQKYASLADSFSLVIDAYIHKEDPDAGYDVEPYPFSQRVVFVFVSRPAPHK